MQTIAGKNGSDGIVSGRLQNLSLQVTIRTTIVPPAGLAQIIADQIEAVFDDVSKAGDDELSIEVVGQSSGMAAWSDRWRFVPNYGGDTGF